MIRVRANWTAPSGGPYLTTMYFDGSTGTDATNAATALSNFLGAVDGSLSSLFSWSIDPTVVFMDETNGDIVSAAAVSVASGSGAGSTDVLPRAVQLMYKWTTGEYINSRQVQGRTFIPGILEGSNIDGTVPPVTQSTFLAFATSFLADANSTPVIWHRPSSPGASDGSAWPINGASVWNKWAVLRRRRD